MCKILQSLMSCSVLSVLAPIGYPAEVCMFVSNHDSQFSALNCRVLCVLVLCSGSYSQSARLSMHNLECQDLSCSARCKSLVYQEGIDDMCSQQIQRSEPLSIKNPPRKPLGGRKLSNLRTRVISSRLYYTYISHSSIV